MASRFAEIKVSDNTVLRVIECDDVVNGVNVVDNPGDTSVETFLKNTVAQDPYVLANHGGVYPNTFWKQSMTIDQSPRWRTKPANISDIWQEDNQRFVSQKDDTSPASYVFNETTGLYEPPVNIPSVNPPEGSTASWDESNLRWIITLSDSSQKYWDPNTSTYIDI